MRQLAAVRTIDWLSGVIDLMREPIGAMPVRPVLTLLDRTFDGLGVSWNWADPDGSFGMVMEPADVLQGLDDTVEQWLTAEWHDCHALMVWHAVTGDWAPYTTARVPTTIVPRERRLLVERPLARTGMEHQLSITYRTDRVWRYAFVAARGGRDYDDSDLEVARHVQQSLISLDRQCTAIATLTAAAGSPAVGADLGLSGRELAVLQLVAEGHATRVVARRLLCSPRTVEKHLESSYRKLGVRDRLNAIRVARLAGVLSAVEQPADPRLDRSRPGVYVGQIRPA